MCYTKKYSPAKQVFAAFMQRVTGRVDDGIAEEVQTVRDISGHIEDSCGWEIQSLWGKSHLCLKRKVVW